MRTPEFWSRNDASARMIAVLAAPLGWAYGASVAWKHRLQTPYRASTKVLCVGNLTVGGSGKTPIAIALAKLLLAKGRRVFFLSRGYGRQTLDSREVKPGDDAAAVGDEALLLARVAPTIVARDRAEGAKLAEARGAEVIVMDDGHQNFALRKDLSIVVVDAETGFGNGKILPAGPLREPVRQGLVRADAVILIGDGEPALDGYRGAILRARLVPAPQAPLAGARVVAFAGIGRPDKFFAALRARGADVVDARAFPDHYVFKPAELAQLRELAARMGARLMTTEKDFMRLDHASRANIEPLVVRAAFDDGTAVEQLLGRIEDRARA